MVVTNQIETLLFKEWLRKKAGILPKSNGLIKETRGK